MLSSVYGMRLKTYGLVTGWLGVIFTLLGLIPLFFVVGLLVEDDRSSDYQDRSSLVIALSIGLPVMVINLLTSGMLIKRHLFLLPWLIYIGVLLALISLAAFGFWMQLISTLSLAAVPVVLFSMAAVALEWYSYYGIYSLYMKIQAKRYSAARRTVAPLEQTPLQN